MQQRNKIALSLPSTIRRFLAGFFLVLFAFTITPKKLLHSLVANHRDGTASAWMHNDNATNLSRSSFNCQTDNPISEPPYLTDTSFHFILSEIPFSIYLNNFVQLQYSTELFCYGLRGPPAC